MDRALDDIISERHVCRVELSLSALSLSCRRADFPDSRTKTLKGKDAVAAATTEPNILGMA